jgi:hypothetical protein
MAYLESQHCPGFQRLIPSLLLVLALASEGKLVLGLAIRDLVDSEPFIGGPQETGKVTFDILNVVEFRSQGIVYVNDNDLPVGLLLVKESHDTENLNLLDLAYISDQLTNLTNIKRIVVALGLGLGVDGVWILPCLGVVSIRDTAKSIEPYLGEGAIVPEITFVGEAVSDISKLAFLDVLLDWIQELFFGDLRGGQFRVWELIWQVRNVGS